MFQAMLFGSNPTMCLRFQIECSVSMLSRLATVALAACGWRQTQPDDKQPFTTVLAFQQKSMKAIQQKILHYDN